jgi:hypothetical protein
MQEKAEEFKKTGGKLYHELAVDDAGNAGAVYSAAKQ